MNEFTAHLRDISRRLPISEPARSRILVEIAADMDDLLQHHMDAGMEEEAAVQAVLDRFRFSDEALRELAHVHDSTLQRSLEGLARQAGSRWERAILALLTLFLGIAMARVLAEPSLLADAGPVVFGMIAVLAFGVGTAVWQGVALVRIGRGTGRAIPWQGRQRLRVLPLLAGLLFLLGFGGVWVDLYRAALRMRSAPSETLVFLAHWLHMASATLVVALAGGLLVGLLWFFLETRATDLETRAAAQLLDATG